ncbi:MAG: aminotransferase class I/II-fold pyridoxal phosphate-dependent enzyme [Bacteroidales bacterium]|nr:aminotransferase class I/II-fold pyridoxal phosphate-dependent enzyme [Bacteroidales bacterium]
MQPSNKTIMPANRVMQVKEYYFSRKLKEVAQMNARGLDVINLGVGSPDLSPSKSTLEALYNDSIQKEANGYQPYIGIPEFRKAYSEWYKRWYNVELNPNTEVQPLIGSKEGILHITLAFVNPGDKVLVPDPGYPTYSSVSNLAEAEIIKYDLKEGNNWYPDFEQIEKNDLSDVKLMWVNYPHMPTGAPATEELFKKLVEFGKKHNIVIVNDNPYSFILNDKPLSILSIEGAKDICIELNSMSKSHNMPGWRIGIACSNETFIQWILRVKSNIDSGVYRPLQKAAVEALNNSSEWHAHNNEIYRQRRIKAEEIMNLLNCKFDKNQKGLFLWGRIPERYENVEQLTEEILHNARVFITPGSIFGKNGERYIRISLCAPETTLEKAYKRIAKSIENVECA